MAAKRIVDLVLAGIMLILAAPVLLIIGIAIRLDSPGPILYKQERWGRGGSTFSLYKFRTLHPGSDSTVLPVAIGDPRVTRVGRFLRKTGLDELPQLMNIWRGEMSFVGPRALAVNEMVEIESGIRMPYPEIPGFEERARALPGLTGPATIYLPKDAATTAKFERDLEYIRSRSLGGDLRLILLSIWISLAGRWEHRGPKL